jgi:hypothetical protein
MSDMSAAIKPKSDQMNSDDLISGPRTITVSRVMISQGEQPVSIFFDGDNGKPYKPCKSMCRVMVHVWGADANNYVGRGMTLYRDPTVKWGGMAIGGIRISHLSHIDNQVVMSLTETKGKWKPFTVKPLRMEAPKQQAASFVLDDAAANDAAAQGMGAYQAFVKALPKDSQREYVANEAHARRKTIAGAVDRLNACTDVIELETEWDVMPSEVCAALGADVLDSLRAKMEPAE